MVEECLRALDSLAWSWSRQRNDLIELDKLLNPQVPLPKVPDPVDLRAELGIPELLALSQFEERARREHVRLISALREGQQLPLPFFTRPGSPLRCTSLSQAT